MLKRWISLCCAAAVACALCGLPARAELLPLDEDGFFPLPEPARLTAWVVNTNGSISVADNAVVDWIREKANVELAVTQEFTGNNAKQRLNVMLETAETLPDILLCTRWTKAECALYGRHGLVIPLEDYLAECKNWNRLDNICGMEHQADLTMPDGHIYCYGSVNECFHLTHQARMWVYQPWIDSLCDGRLPRTTDEFRDYLVKVASMDPNGNGIADEIPLIGEIQEGWATDPFTFLSNAFVHNNAIFGSTNQTVASGCYVRDGQVMCNWVEDGYREALRYMADLYQRGLIYNQTFTQDFHQMTARLTAEPHLVGAAANGHFPVVLEAPTDSGAWCEWTCLPPLAGPDGTRLSYQSVYDYFYNCNGLVTRDCQNPELAVRLFDLLASSEGTLVQNYGREGINWAWCDPEDGHGVNGAPALYRFFWTPGVTEKNFYWPSDVQIGSNFELFRNGAIVPEGMFNGEEELWQCAELYERYSPGKDTVYPNLVCPEEQFQQLQSYQTLIERYVQKSTVYFIAGDMNLESDWVAYLTTLDILGQAEYRQLLQNAYDAWLAGQPGGMP